MRCMFLLKRALFTAITTLYFKVIYSYGFHLGSTFSPTKTPLNVVVAIRWPFEVIQDSKSRTPSSPESQNMHVVVPEDTNRHCKQVGKRKCYFFRALAYSSSLSQKHQIRKEHETTFVWNSYVMFCQEIAFNSTEHSPQNQQVLWEDGIRSMTSASLIVETPTMVIYGCLFSYTTRGCERGRSHLE